LGWDQSGVADDAGDWVVTVHALVVPMDRVQRAADQECH